MISPVVVVVALMVSMTTSCEVSGRGRQLRLIAENSRCSILFQLDVPGGRWQTVMQRPVSVAGAASSVFPQPQPRPVGPTGIGGDQQPVGVGIGAGAHGVLPPADRLDGKLAGVGVGADIDPTGVRGDVVHPVRRDLPQLLVHEVVDVGVGGPALSHSRPLAVKFPIAPSFWCRC